LTPDNHRGVQAVQRRAVPGAQVGGELLGVQGFLDGRVVHVPVVVEVAGQVLVRVAPPARALHPHLAAAQGLPQGDEHAQRPRRCCCASNLPDLLFEVNSWTGFLEEFTHISEGASRMAGLPTSLVALLVAEACNIGLTPVTNPHTRS
jgi:hypothetical protein